MARSDSPLGSYSWLSETNGVPTPRQRFSLVGRAWWAGGKALTHRLGIIGWRHLPSRGSLSLRIDDRPATTFARAAEEACRDLLASDELVKHSLRTWAFGQALAERDGTEIDRESFFVASMLHDIGLARPTYGSCFTLTGAQLAIDLGGEHDKPEADALAIADAIGHHITPGLRNGPGQQLGYYLQGGSMLDLGGYRTMQLPKEFVQNVCCTWTLDGVKKEAGARWRAEASMVRHGRAHLLQRWTGFGHLTRLSPHPPNQCNQA